MKPDHVLVKLRCNSRHQEMSLCVRINKAVPEPIRCTPSGGGTGGGGSPLCPECQALLDAGRLASRVEEIARRGWSDHVKAGAVIVSC